MNNNDKINSIEFTAMYIILSITSFLGIGVYCVTKSAGINAYLSIVINFFVGFLLLFVFFKIWNYEPNLNILEKNKKLFGNIIGSILNFLFVLIIISYGISGLYNCLSFINSQMLPETPLLFIGIIFGLIGIFANNKGIETISRASVIIVGINLVLYSIAALNVGFNFKLDNILPFLNNGIKPVLKGSFYVFLQQMIPIFTLLIIPKNKIINNSKSTKSIILGYSLSMILILFLLLITIGSLGAELLKFYTYPEYMVLKSIEIFNFIDRIENVITIQWIFGYLMSFTLIIYYIKEYIKKGSKNTILLSIISIFLVILTCNTFKTESQYGVYIYEKAPYLKSFEIILVVVVFIRILFSKKKKVV